MSHLKVQCKPLFLLLILVFLAAFNGADEDFGKEIAARLQKFRSTYPQEKAYLHLDKPYYATGDTLWFKAYLVEGSLHLPDSASNVLYVDMIEQKTGRSVALKRINLLGGLGQGEIVLADSIVRGAYTIRAYTNWMRNFSEDFLFQKRIFLFDQEVNTALAPATDVDVQFFPEGGQLVAGTHTRVAFKAVNSSGVGATMSGFVTNQKNDTIASFKTEHLGMGRFVFEPKSGEKYTAYLKMNDDIYQPYPFPAVQETGYTLVVDNLSNPFKMRVIAYLKSPGESEKQVHIVGHSKGIISFVAKGKITGRGLMMSLPTTELPDGITQLTLFDDQNKPVCERLVFIDHGRSLRVNIKPGKPSYKVRERSEIEVTVTDSAGKPVEANLSLSVTDAGQIAQQPYDANMVSYLLLSSDLAGFVEQPSYYFDPEKSERKIHMDYLMMTQGWRRFRWQDVMQDSLAPAQRYVEQGITLEGDVKRSNKQVTEKVMLSLYLSNDSLTNFMTAETNEKGHFTIYNLVFTDSLQIRLQGMNKKGNQNLSFDLYPFLIPKTTLVKVPYYPVTVESQQLTAYLKRAREEQEIATKIRLSREKLLQEVTIKAKKDVLRDSRKLYNTADATLKITPQMASGNRSVLDMLAGRVAGVQVMGSGLNASVFIRGNRGEPLFVLDGMTVDKNMITSLNVFDVESIDVLKGASAAIYGSRAANGVISVLTKRGNENYDYSKEVVPGVLVSKIAGFDMPREFYAPKYEVKRPEDGRPDYRSTIFWAPMLKTGKDGKASVAYYNSDASTTVEIHADVLSTSGLPGSAKAAYLLQ